MEFAPETDVTSLNFHDTELTLRLPGDPRHFLVVDLNAKSSSAPSCGAACAGRDEPESMSSSAGKSPSAKEEVGWPPLRCFRKKAFQSGRFVKVAVDGAPYLRKVDLEAYCNYRELLRALAEISTCLLYKSYSIEENKLMDWVEGSELMVTYEDKNGDWMLVGDLPWKMFKESCKRIRLKKSFVF